MSKISIKKKKYDNSPLASRISLIGSLVSFLALIPGLIMTGMSFMGLLASGFRNPQSWGMFAGAVVALVVCVIVLFVIRIVFNLIADNIANK